MSALVVYESLYGNTRDVAEAIATGLGDAKVVSVQDAVSQVTKADLLVVGGPTHVHGIASRRTRTAGAQNAHGELEPGSGDGPGLRDWLADLPQVANAQAAAFDTRATKVRYLPASASRRAAHLLAKHGCRMVTSPAGRPDPSGVRRPGRFSSS